MVHLDRLGGAVVTAADLRAMKVRGAGVGLFGADRERLERCWRLAALALGSMPYASRLDPVRAHLRAAMASIDAELGRGEIEEGENEPDGRDLDYERKERLEDRR